MPRQYTAYEPDQIDCENMVNAIANDFGLLAEIETQYARDKVWTFVRCRVPAADSKGKVQVQAVASCPLKTAKSLYIYQYSALLDCWHQCDRGVLGAAARPIERGWNGRPRTPERSAKHK